MDYLKFVWPYVHPNDCAFQQHHIQLYIKLIFWYIFMQTQKLTKVKK